MVDSEGAFQAVRRHVVGGPEAAHVVDQHVQPGIGRDRFAGHPADLGLGREVGDEDVDLGTGTSGADFVCRGASAFEVSPDDPDTRAQTHQPGRGRLADAPSAAGH